MNLNNSISCWFHVSFTKPFQVFLIWYFDMYLCSLWYLIVNSMCILLESYSWLNVRCTWFKDGYFVYCMLLILLYCMDLVNEDLLASPMWLQKIIVMPAFPHVFTLQVRFYFMSDWFRKSGHGIIINKLAKSATMCQNKLLFCMHLSIMPNLRHRAFF